MKRSSSLRYFTTSRQYNAEFRLYRAVSEARTTHAKNTDCFADYGQNDRKNSNFNQLSANSVLRINKSRDDE